jgi:hypothetical protein
LARTERVDIIDVVGGGVLDEDADDEDDADDDDDDRDACLASFPEEDVADEGPEDETALLSSSLLPLPASEEADDEIGISDRFPLAIVISSGARKRFEKKKTVTELFLQRCCSVLCTQ